VEQYLHARRVAHQLLTSTRKCRTWPWARGGLGLLQRRATARLRAFYLPASISHRRFAITYANIDTITVTYTDSNGNCYANGYHDSNSHTSRHTNGDPYIDGYGNSDGNTRAVVNANDHSDADNNRNTLGVVNADSDSYCDADPDCHAEAYA
jgi:hypothetical protein